MNEKEQTYTPCHDSTTPPNGILNRLARGLVLKSLAQVKQGHLVLIDRDERLEFGQTGSELTTNVRVQHPDFYRRVAFGGTIAAGESYMDGLWSSSDLTALVRIMVRNQEAQLHLEGGLARLTAPLQRLLHRLNDNTRSGSRKNIAAHYDLATKKITICGPNNQITLLQQDYRDLTGQFDRLVSIEMIEAVGHRHLPNYFRVCSDQLKPDGAALIQAITMPDHHYERYLNAPDFISRYIFLGSCCPSLHAISNAVARTTDLRLNHLEDLSPHYARTLQEWRSAFHAKLDRVKEMGFDQRFIRMWDYYLSYCEGGFTERFTGVVQLLFTKPGYREEQPEARSRGFLCG
jgi:hypothetical protein